MSEDIDILEVVHSITLTDRQFYSNIRYLDSATRNNVILTHERNTREALSVLRNYLDPPPPRAPPRSQRIIVNVPLNLDLSGNNFYDPVFIRPTQAVINAATESQIPVVNTVCAICQDTVLSATRIRHCGHCFHGTCISQWFTINTRCPVCRHDIRELTDIQSQETNDSGVHPN
jgi:hypothetical protein